tara:strand:- start:790 stop:972 length:183 start_codon:yes stop_codon:yes gene_type:complete
MLTVQIQQDNVELQNIQLLLVKKLKPMLAGVVFFVKDVVMLDLICIEDNAVQMVDAEYIK